MDLFSRQGRTVLLLALAVITLWQRPSQADALSDAIYQAGEAKEESQRLARDAEDRRQKVRQLYEEAKLVKFQLAADEFLSARSAFERAADSFQKARYYLERLQSTQNPELASTAEENFREAGRHYDEGARRANKGVEWLNGGIEEYNQQLRDERKSQAAKNRTDAFDLMDTIKKKLVAIQGQKGSANAVSCLEKARDKAKWAFGDFHSAVENADREDVYREKVQSGIGHYNEAVQILKMISDTGQCQR
jgi:hypothetical protein